ncbi:MAG: phosphatase PAP2 family protein [Bacteroidota bacterium]|nr:phosphatase PAP2 family protein [Bacteroidota bacterium]
MDILEAIRQIDQTLLLFLNSFHNSFWDKANILWTSKEIWYPFYALMLYFIIKKYRRNSIYIIIILALAIAVSDQFSGLIKDLTQRLRPTHDPNLNGLIHNIVNKGGLYGFFSAHAANSFTVAAFTTFLFRNRWYSMLIFIWAIVVSYTRIYLGLHFPLDILTGCVWGILTGFAAYKAILWIQKKYFKSMLPDISKTNLSNEESATILVSFIIYIATMLLTINRLAHYQFFN